MRECLFIEAGRRAAKSTLVTQSRHDEAVANGHNLADEVRSWGILLQKSFCGMGLKFTEP